ncbi:MAG: VanW family protein [Deltaproteobacteria bacterium]|nr:VanW family protein [Deltaproteobacteria bacterium]
MSGGTAAGAGWRTRVEWAALAAVFLGAGAAAGAVVRRGASPAPEDKPLVPVAAAAGGLPQQGTEPPPAVVPGLGRVRVAGQIIELGQPIRPQVLAAARAYLSSPVELRAGGETLTVTRAQLGAVVPVAHVAEVIEQAAAGQGPLRRLLERAASEVHDLPILIDLDDQVALGRLIAFKNRFDRQAESAKYDFGAGRPRPESAGRHLMLYRGLAAIQDALEDGAAAVALPVETVVPRLTSAEVETYDFSQLLGWYETEYSRMPEQETRNFNLRLAGSFVDGSIIPAGADFSMNEAVGERSEVRGFKVAPVIAEGELIDGIGGGTCQIASTTFAASFFSGLDLVRRRPHSRPSGYILLGLDATVVYPTTDLVLGNRYDFPVALHLTVAEGVVRVEVWGARKVYTVSFIRDAYQVFDFQEQVIEMPDWPAGAEVLSQRGVKGYRMKRHRVLCEGTACWRESSESHYPPTMQIIRRGTNPSIPLEGFELPRSDPHKPYSADRHLIATQNGPTLDDMVILRRN